MNDDDGGDAPQAMRTLEMMTEGMTTAAAMQTMIAAVMKANKRTPI